MAGRQQEDYQKIVNVALSLISLISRTQNSPAPSVPSPGGGSVPSGGPAPGGGSVPSGGPAPGGGSVPSGGPAPGGGSVPSGAHHTSRGQKQTVENTLKRSIPDSTHGNKLASVLSKTIPPDTAPVRCVRLPFFLLPGPTDRSPRRSEEVHLRKAGLGRRTLALLEDAGHSQIEKALKEQYPRLKELSGGWLLHKATGAGAGQQKLAVVPAEGEGYTARLLQTASGRGRNVLYIVPLREELGYGPLSCDAPPGFEKMPKSTCQTCGAVVPSQLLALHVEICDAVNKNVKMTRDCDQRLSGRRVISNEIRAMLVDHVINHGLSMSEAGQRVQPNLSRFAVASIIRTFRKENRIDRPPGHGERCWRFTPEQETAIVNMVLANNTIRLREIQKHIIKDKTIFNDIHHVGLATLDGVLQRNQIQMKQVYRMPFDQCYVYVQMKEPAASEAEGEEAGVSTASTKDPSVVSELKGRLDCGGGDATSSVGPQTVKETVRTGATRTLPGIVKTGVEGVSSDASGSPADPTALAGSSSPCGGEPASTAKHKTEEEVDGVVKEMPVIHAVGEDVNTESSTSANVRSTKACDTDEQMDTGEDIETKEEGDGDSKKDLNETPVTVTESKDVDQSEVSKDTTTDNVEPLSCKSNEDRIAVSWDVATSSQSLVNTSTNDLDEMMDMGTVDQVEQEAQMQDEEQRSLVEIDTSNSPMLTIVNTVSVDSKTPGAQDLEDKSSVLPQSKEELQSEDKVPVESTERSSPSSSEAASTGKSNTSTVANGLKIATVSSANLENAKQSSQASPAAEDSSVSDTVRVSFSPSLVKVKDEPLDEEYDQALTSNTSTAGIKDEPDTKENLQISSVYSVGGTSVPASSPSTAGLPKPVDPSAQSPSMPPLIPAAIRVACSHCRKVLMKGQTAFQRKGSPDLFCSTTCLSAMPLGTIKLPVHQPPSATTNTNAKKTCHYCMKAIARPQDVVLAPVDDTSTRGEFCGQTCLSAFNCKRSFLTSIKSTKTPIQPLVTQSVCSVCGRTCISKHEVILNGLVHKMCSEFCFVRFRKANNLIVANCANCGSYCFNKPLSLKSEDTTKTFCNAECLAKLKEKTKSLHPCTMCRVYRPMSDMIDNKDSDGKVDLFCSSSCVMAYKVQTVSASGAVVMCDNCSKSSVPAYHLAMSDTSIRNFCTLNCVMTFQEKFNKSQKQVNIATKSLVAAAPTQSKTVTTSAPIQPEAPKGPAKLPCFQCHTLITAKPELIQFKDKMMFLCSVACTEEYKKVNYIIGLCEYCKIEKVTKDVRRINKKDCHFCSEGCKLLYKHDLAKRWGKHCRSCAFCSSISQAHVVGQYGGKTEIFCSEDCRSKYTMLFCQVAKCDLCGRQGKLMDSLPMLGEAKHFCDVQCLLHFCSKKTLSQGQVSIIPSPGSTGQTEPIPVIANVVSLASAPTGQPTSFANAALQGTVPKAQSKILGHASTQTDTVKGPAPPPPRILKNKALLCKPMVQNKGVTCKTQMVNNESQTEDNFPRVIVLPVPVPVFIPVPMNMYSQYTPRPVGLPIPLPVPMFLPVTMDSAERIVETIQEIKQKIPSDPFEADLILMAEMVAEQEGRDEKEEAKKRGLGKDRDRPEALVPDDHASNYSDDLDTDDLASFLNNWDDPSSSTSLRSPNRPAYANEKLHPILDIPVGMSREPAFSEHEPVPPPPPVMDIEADFPVDSLELISQMREQAQRSPSPPPTPSQRRNVRRTVRDRKKGRKSRRPVNVEVAAVASSPPDDHLKAMSKVPPKLESKYGIDAWKRWIRWRDTQPNLEKPRFGSRPMELKEDVLRCTTAELSYGLSRFVSEIKRPTGEPYSPDSMFYLCLGIQQHLFANGRLENIFTDVFYSKFSTDITRMLKDFKPSVTPSGYIHSRVEEEYLWDCKQLGAYSPIVLLNTLLYFCTKHFGFLTVEQHRQLSFAHVMRCTKTTANSTKSNFLRFYPPISMKELEALPQTDADGVPAKRRREEEVMLEMMENSENPLRCPVRLYEFYLSKCSESVKQRTNLFYLNPERSCVPNSPLWFSSASLDDGTMEAMLTRILTVRQQHIHPVKEPPVEAGQPQPEDPAFVPGEDEDDSD